MLRLGREAEAIEFVRTYNHRTEPLEGDLVGMAVRFNSKAFLEFLLLEGECLEPHHVFAAIEGQCLPMAKMLIEEQGFPAATVDPDKTTSLMTCAEVGSISIARLLLKHGVNINLTDEEGRTALSYCCMRYCGRVRLKMAKFLLSQGADERIEDDEGRDFIGQLKAHDKSSKEAERVMSSVAEWRRQKNLREVCTAFFETFMAYNHDTKSNTKNRQKAKKRKKATKLRAKSTGKPCQDNFLESHPDLLRVIMSYV